MRPSLELLRVMESPPVVTGIVRVRVGKVIQWGATRRAPGDSFWEGAIATQQFSGGRAGVLRGAGAMGGKGRGSGLRGRGVSHPRRD